jgi:hypothetical protein
LPGGQKNRQLFADPAEDPTPSDFLTEKKIWLSIGNQARHNKNELELCPAKNQTSHAIDDLEIHSCLSQLCHMFA